jgi:hypothetical protein
MRICDLPQLQNQGKDAAMIPMPRDFRPLLNHIVASVGQEATARRLIIFFSAATLVIGRRTGSAVFRLLGLIEMVHPSTFHRLFSHRKWMPIHPAKVIALFVVQRFVPQGPITLVGDETVDGHRGKKVYGKARHRDAVRSSHSHTVFRYGHKWIVLAILVHFPYTIGPLRCQFSWRCTVTRRHARLKRLGIKRRWS